ncbi:MAG: GAF domain-containing protein [Anaerolineae bacterium]|nr:GAF domain-containing protein [Anaerolineae bacterium]
MGRVAITGNGILVAHGVFQFFNGIIPFRNASVQQMLPLLVPLASGYLIMQVIGIAVTDVNPLRRFKSAGRGLLMEPLLVMVTIVLPLIDASIGSMAFVIMVGLTGAQAIRHHQVRDTHNHLMRRLKEISLLNNLSQNIASSIELDEVLGSIYREIRNLVNATTFYVALYNHDRQTIEFPLAFKNGQLEVWSTRQLGNSLSDYIVRSRKTVFLDTQNKSQLETLHIEPSNLAARVYVGIPLLLGEKLIGVLVVAHQNNPLAFSDNDIDLLQTIASQASLALRNATLYKRSVNLAHNLSLINQSLQDIMFNLDRRDAMRSACKVALQVTNAQKAAFFLLQPNRDNRLELAQWLGFEGQPRFASLPYQPHLFRDGPRIITDIDDVDDPLLQQHAQDANFKSIVQIPLRSGTTMVGCMCVYHQAIHFHETPEINLLIMLANQITAALDNGDLLQALELYATEQSQLFRLSRTSTVNLDLESVIYETCSMLAQMMDLQRAEIGLHEPETKRLQFYMPMSDSLLKKTDMPLRGIPELEEVLLGNTGAASNVYYADVPTYSDALHVYMSENDDETLAVLPLQINQQNMGLLLLGDANHRLFNDNENRLLEMATHQIAVHLHNARIHTLTEETLLKRLEELSLLEESAQQVSQVLDTDRLINNVLIAAIRATQAEFAALALLNPSEPHLFDIIFKQQVKTGVEHRTLTVTLEQGIIRQVANSGEVVIVENNQESNNYQPVPDSPTTYRSSLAVPLLKGKQVIGVLDIESTQTNFFTSEHVNFIKSLAGHATVSLSNAHLVEELNTNIERMRAILNSTRDGIILLDHEGRILDANTAAEDLLGIPLRQNLENKLKDIVSHHPLLVDLSNTYGHNPQTLHECEYLLSGSNDQDIIIKIFVTQVKNSDNQPGHVLLLRDITEEKELEKFRETNQSMVIHDLLGPITSIISNLYWIIQLVEYPGTKPIQEALLPSLANSVKSAQNLMNLVETLRDIPMITQMEIQPKPVFVQELVTTAYELTSGLILEANITFNYEIPEGLTVTVDNDLIQRAFTNLLHNAAKFTPIDGHILIIVDSDSPQADYVRVRVCDSGMGIPTEHRERIFQQFVQIEGQRPRAGGKGTGLGLNFCKLVLEAHGGSIWVEDDNPLSGACFAFTLLCNSPSTDSNNTNRSHDE